MIGMAIKRKDYPMTVDKIKNNLKLRIKNLGDTIRNQGIRLPADQDKMKIRRDTFITMLDWIEQDTQQGE